MLFAVMLGLFMAGLVCGAILCHQFYLGLAPRGDFGQILDRRPDLGAPIGMS